MKTKELFEAYKEELAKVVKGDGDKPGRFPSGGNAPSVVVNLFSMPFDEEAFEAACKRVGVGTSDHDLDEMVAADRKAEDEERKKKFREKRDADAKEQAAELAKKLAAVNKAVAK